MALTLELHNKKRSYVVRWQTRNEKTLEMNGPAPPNMQLARRGVAPVKATG